MYKKALLVVVLFSILWIYSFGESTTIILSNKINDFILAKNYYDLLEDSSGSLTIDNVSSIAYANRFNRSSLDYNYIKNTNAAYWIKFAVKDTSSQINKWVLELLSLHTQNIQFYIPTEKDGYVLYQTGQHFKFYQRPYSVTNFVFDLPAETDKAKTFYVRIVSKHVVGFEFKIRSQSYFTQYTISEYFFLGLYYGILLIMGVYNLLIYVNSKERVYFFYVLYVLSCMLNSLSEDGLGFQFLWPNHPEWNWAINNYIWAFFFLLSFTIYSTEFLELKKLYKKLYYSILFSVGFYFIAFLLNFNFDLFDLFLLPFLVTYGVGIYVFVKGYKPARFFVLGFSLVFISIIIYQLRINNVIGHNIFTVYSFNYGIVLEVVVLSIALGDRIKIMKAEKEHSQLLLIDKLEENQLLQQKVNKELEEKVSIRTAELLQKSEELEEANEKLKKMAADLNKFASKLDYDNWELNKKVTEETKARILSKEVSFEEFNKIFPDEFSCFKYLEELKWGGEYVCKKCGNGKYAFQQKLLSRKCSKCNYVESVITSTIFQGVKFDITKAFYIAYVASSKNDNRSIDELAELLQLNRSTCWKFRKRVLEKEAELLQKLKVTKIEPWELLLKD